MIKQVPTLNRLVNTLQQIPYLANRNIYRIVTHFLTMDEKHLEQFCATLLAAKEKVIPCSICFAWQEADAACLFCNAPKRDQQLVCVVATWHDLLAIEKTGGYDGVYHILGGLIYPLEGIGPDDLTIEPLIKRVQTKQVTELILATNQTPEGEATAAFIARKLKEQPVRVSCLARGIPVGSALDAMDRVTVFKALAERRPF